MEKVEQFYNKNQFLIKGQSGITFQSYKSTIANIDKNGDLTLFADWDYSKTTLKHLYLFIHDYFCKLNYNTRDLLIDLEYSKNKRDFLQKLIDSKKLTYIVEWHTKNRKLYKNIDFLAHFRHFMSFLDKIFNF